MSRMYDPETGRFLQEDTYRGDPSDALSLNLYTYCHNEPMMYDDPTGHIWRDMATDDAGNYVFSNGKKYTNHPEVKNAKAKVNELEKIARQKVNKNSIGKDYIEGFVDHFKNYLTMANEFSEHPVKTIILLPYQANPFVTEFESNYAFYEQVIMGDKHTRARYAGDFTAMLLEMYLTKKVGDGAGKLLGNEVPCSDEVEDIKGGSISETFDKASAKLGSFGNVISDFFKNPSKKPGYIKFGDFFNKGVDKVFEFPEWKPGDPITKMTSEGKYPSWNIIRERYWINRAKLDSSNFSPQNIGRMKEGLAPEARILVKDRITGKIYEKIVSKEIHHSNGNRGVPGFDEPINLREVWPWEHENLLPPGRRLNYDFIKFK